MKEGVVMVKNTKEAIMDAAISLFNTNGFAGTSIRDVAKKANTNVSNISYYFGSKHGLLETCFTTYFEEYLKQIEKGYNESKEGALHRLKQITENILQFQSRNIQLTRLVLREVSLDSQMVREIMSTYLVKERYYFKKVMEEGILTKEFHSFSVNYLIIQYKSLLTMPFLNPFYLTEVLQVFPNESYFVKRYYKELCFWMEGVLCNKRSELLPMVIT